ncbi:protein of unknown function [Agreia sp. COWG]|nr:protein of unknown function [Agreia sp. COWG]
MKPTHIVYASYNLRGLTFWLLHRISLDRTYVLILVA